MATMTAVINVAVNARTRQSINFLPAAGADVIASGRRDQVSAADFEVPAPFAASSCQELQKSKRH
jgi:hypothetical protein